jgi:Glucodextranase, domain B
MLFRIGPAMVCLALAVSMAATALAQVDDDTPTADDAPAAETPADALGIDQPSVAPTLFVRVVDPADPDIQVPLSTDVLTVRGVTLPGAVVSLDGDLVATDDQGDFSWLAQLDEGANEIEVVASDDQGNQTSTTLFVVRGE